jgi:hypothetical protein
MVLIYANLDRNVKLQNFIFQLKMYKLGPHEIIHFRMQVVSKLSFYTLICRAVSTYLYPRITSYNSFLIDSERLKVH